MFASTIQSLRLYCVTILGSLLLCFPAAVVAQDVTTAQANAESGVTESLDVRYARAHLELAKLDLQRVLEMHKRFPNITPVRAIESLQKHVVIDQEQLDQALQAPDGRLHEIHLRAADLAVETAEADLLRRREAFKKTPTSLERLDVERAEVVVKLARLQRERAQKQEVSLSSLAYLQWQIEVLRNDLLELRVLVESKVGQ